MDDLFSINKKEQDRELLVDLFKAYRDARKNKRAKKSQLEFEFNYESKLFLVPKFHFGMPIPPTKQTNI